MYMLKKETRNSPNGYVTTAVQVTEQNTKTKHCSAKREKEVKVNNSLQHRAGCIMVDMGMKFHYPISLGVYETE